LRVFIHLSQSQMPHAIPVTAPVASDALAAVSPEHDASARRTASQSRRSPAGEAAPRPPPTCPELEEPPSASHYHLRTACGAILAPRHARSAVGAGRVQNAEAKPLGGYHGLTEFGVTVLPTVDARRVHADPFGRLLDAKPASDERGEGFAHKGAELGRTPRGRSGLSFLAGLHASTADGFIVIPTCGSGFSAHSGGASSFARYLGGIVKDALVMPYLHSALGAPDRGGNSHVRPDTRVYTYCRWRCGARHAAPARRPAPGPPVTVVTVFSGL
jgi:hypothetical protein